MIPASHEPLLGPGEPDPVELLRPDSESPILLICDHAGQRIPARLGTLGLPDAELERHIAYDIGAGEVTRGLSASLVAPAVLQRYSRLVVDCNRAPAASDFIATISETTAIPGNRDLPATEVAARTRTLFEPYHDTIRALLDQRATARIPTVLVAVHSCTPVYHGVSRPWHIGVLYNRDDRYARILLGLLARHGELTIGENQPYELTHERDYSVPVHGEERGIPHVELEIRQDLITGPEGQAAWVERLTPILLEGVACLADFGAC